MGQQDLRVRLSALGMLHTSAQWPWADLTEPSGDGGEGHSLGLGPTHPAGDNWAEKQMLFRPFPQGILGAQDRVGRV